MATDRIRYRSGYTYQLADGYSLKVGITLTRVAKEVDRRSVRADCTAAVR